LITDKNVDNACRGQDDGLERQNLKAFCIVVCPVSNKIFHSESQLTDSSNIVSIWFIDQAVVEDAWILANICLTSFCTKMQSRLINIHVHKKDQGHFISRHLDWINFVSKGCYFIVIMAYRTLFYFRIHIQWATLAGVAVHSARFGSTCSLVELAIW